MTDYRFVESGGLRASEVATTLRALESYVAAGATVYSDNFDRADSGSLGAGWTGDFTIVSNKCNVPSGGDKWGRFETDLGSPDHWVEADVNTSGNYLIVHARQTTGGANQTCYMGFLQPDGAHVEIGRNVSGSYATLNTASVSATGGLGKLRLEVEGGAQRLYLNDTLVCSAADGTTATGNYVGFNANIVSGNGTYDNFRCGALPWTP